MCVCVVPFVARSGHWITKAGITESCGLPCGSGEMNLGPLVHCWAVSPAPITSILFSPSGRLTFKHLSKKCAMFTFPCLAYVTEYNVLQAATKDKSALFFYGCVTVRSVYIPRLLYLLTNWWPLWWSPYLGNCEWCWDESVSTQVLSHVHPFSSEVASRGPWNLVTVLLPVYRGPATLSCIFANIVRKLFILHIPICYSFACLRTTLHWGLMCNFPLYAVNTIG